MASASFEVTLYGFAHVPDRGHAAQSRQDRRLHPTLADAGDRTGAGALQLDLVDEKTLERAVNPTKMVRPYVASAT
jgi:hypothetical protein